MIWYPGDMSDLKTWTKLFKGLGNVSRLRIITLLSKEGPLSVGDIAREIHVSIKGTSKHVLILHALNILDRDGRAGQVFYSLRRDMDPAARSIINKFLS